MYEHLYVRTCMRTHVCVLVLVYAALSGRTDLAQDRGPSVMATIRARGTGYFNANLETSPPRPDRRGQPGVNGLPSSPSRFDSLFLYSCTAEHGI